MELFGHHLCPEFPPLPSRIDDNTARDTNIIIIGAGVSGLSAAATLKQLGFNKVVILEASNQIGGRLKSTSFLNGDGGPPLDIGAEWIHSVKGGEVLRSIVKGYDDDSSKDDVVVVPELIEYKPTIFHNKSKSRVLTWLYKETKFKNTTWYHWLVSNFESVLDRVELNTPVTNVSYHHTSSNDVVTLTMKDGTTRTADRVICTVPLQILKEEVITFTPPFTDERMEALTNIQMPPGFRVLFRMSQKFYEGFTYVGSFFGHQADDLLAIYDPLYGKELSKNDLHVIACVAIGPVNAGEMSKLSDEELGKALLAKIDELYDGKGSKYVVGEPIVQNWTAEPYVRGSYTFPAPKKYRKELGKPIGSDGKGKGLVYFAGEHTSLTHHSLVPGAAFEGRRAALEVASSLGIDVGTTQ
eukprot:scaffold47634_cov32-Cyclotella_meneghiniana.AAC.4